MKSYVFDAYVFNGEGKVISLAAWDLSDDDYYFPSQRKLLPLGYVSVDFDNTRFGYTPIEVTAASLKEALRTLSNYAHINHLDLVLSPKYYCHSFGRTSKRNLRFLDLSV